MKAKYFKVNYASSKNDMLSSALALIKTFFLNGYLFQPQAGGFNHPAN